MSEWKTVILSEVCDLVAGFAFKSKDFGKFPNKVIKITHITPPSVDINNLSGIDIEKYDDKKLEKFIAKKGDYVLAMTGATIGKIGRIGHGYAYINQRVLLFKPHSSIDKNFLYYTLQQYGFSQYILNHIDSDSAQPNISATTIGKFQFDLPPMFIQKKIGSLLCFLDDKIENNNKINHNLEQMAQAIFKSWFVDFEPFGGVMPSDWREGTLSDVLNVCYGKDHKHLGDGKIPCYGSGGIMRYVNNHLFTGESVLIPRKGTLNNVLYVNEAFWTVDTMFYTQMKLSNVAKLAYFFVKNLNLSEMNVGSAVPSMTTTVLNSIEIVLPDVYTLSKFEEIVSPLFLQIKANNNESVHLASLRDTLLPRLMSGELSVSDITT